MQYFIGHHPVTKKVIHVMSTQDGYDIVKQAENDGLIYNEVTSDDFIKAYPCPLFHKWDDVNKSLIINDDQNDIADEIMIPSNIELHPNLELQSHVQIKDEDGNIRKRRIGQPRAIIVE